MGSCSLVLLKHVLWSTPPYLLIETLEDISTLSLDIFHTPKTYNRIWRIRYNILLLSCLRTRSPLRREKLHQPQLHRVKLPNHKASKDHHHYANTRTTQRILLEKEITMIETVSVFYLFIVIAFGERVISCIMKQPMHPRYFYEGRTWHPESSCDFWRSTLANMVQKESQRSEGGSDGVDEREAECP